MNFYWVLLYILFLFFWCVFNHWAPHNLLSSTILVWLFMTITLFCHNCYIVMWQRYNSPSDPQHGIRGLHRECVKPPHFWAALQMACQAAQGTIPASERGANVWANQPGDGGDEEDNQVLSPPLHFHLQHQSQWWDLRRDGVEAMEEGELALRGLQPL